MRAGSGNTAVPAGRSMRSSKLTKSSSDYALSSLQSRTLQPVEEASPLSIWPGGWILYEISTRPWLYTLTKKYKRPITKLNDIPDEEFLALKDRGVDMVWMMGVFQLGAYGLKYDRTNVNQVNGYRQLLPDYTEQDVIGSPYAIVDYHCNSQLGTDEDLRNFHKRLNSLGLYLMLDFVPNHTAVDCEWAKTDPNFYVRSPKDSQQPYSDAYHPETGIAYGSCGWGAWQDTLQLNHWNPELARLRTQELCHVASMCDGIRCDMAYLALNDLIEQNWGHQLYTWGWKKPATEWWEGAIKAVKQRFPNVVLLAEVYSPWQPRLQELGFDYTYDKQLYDRLSWGHLDYTKDWFIHNSPSFTKRSAHFVSNHDEPREAIHFGSWWRAAAAALLSFTLPGVRFFWQGQWEGHQNKLAVHLRRAREEQPHSEVVAFYDKLLPIISHEIFKKGEWVYLDVWGTDQSWRLMAWRWSYGKERRLCVLNFSDYEGTGRVIVSDAEGEGDIPIVELLSGEKYERSAKEMRQDGLFVIVPPWYGQIFSY